MIFQQKRKSSHKQGACQIMPRNISIFRFALSILFEHKLRVVRNRAVIRQDRDSVSSTALLHQINVSSYKSFPET